MGMLWKKISALVLALLMVSALAATGLSEDNVTAPGEYPIAKEPVELTVFVTARPNVDDFVNNTATKYLEEKLGIKLKFVVAPDEEARQKLNLLFSTGDYPDVILGTWKLSRTEVDYYSAQGLFIPLDDLIEEYGVNTKKVFEEYPYAVTFSTMSDGLIHTLPDVVDGMHTSGSMKIWYYQPFLDALGMEIPTTTEEFVTYLKAVKDNDPNGNGVADEVPAAGSLYGWHSYPVDYLLQAFLYNDPAGARLRVTEDGVVETIASTEEFREGLRFIKSLVDEGLLDKNTFTQDLNSLIMLSENSPDPILGVSWGGFEGSFADLSGSRWKDWVIGPPLEGPEGVSYSYFNPDYAYYLKSAITSTCENPEIAFRFIDALYDREIYMNTQIGVEGEHWAWAEEGEEGYAGEGVWKRLVSSGDVPPNTHWDQNGNMFQNDAFRIGEVIDVEADPMESILYFGTVDYYVPTRPSIDILYPALVVPTEDDAQEMSSLEVDISTKIAEMMVRFIVGEADLDADWDAYVNDLEAAGMSRYLELKQKSYDEYLKTK